MTASPPAAPGRLHPPPERCPSGRRSTPGKCVWVNSPSRVRLEPPPGGERTRRRRSRRAAPKGVSRRRRRIIPPSPQPFRHHHPLPRSPRAGYDTFCDDRVPAAVAPGRLHSPRRGVRAAEGARLESVYGLIAHRGFESLPLRHARYITCCLMRENIEPKKCIMPLGITKMGLLPQFHGADLPGGA